MTEVRYYSRSGNTRAVAEAIAKAAGVTAVSVTDTGAAIKDKTDILFIGGALYAYGIDADLRSYIDTLSSDKVDKAVAFSTSWLSRHALDLIRKGLEEKGISVSEETLYFRGKPNETQLKEAEEFAKRFTL